MEHSYLFHEGLWVASGHYFDDAARTRAVKGHSRITHGEMWEVESFMQLMKPPRLTFENHYRVSPFEAGADFTVWSSHNPAIGPVSGRFFLIGDTILSIFASEDGRYTGSEFFLSLDENLYQNRGALFKDQGRISSWAVKLARAGRTDE